MLKSKAEKDKLLKYQMGVSKCRKLKKKQRERKSSQKTSKMRKTRKMKAYICERHN
jgi:hypothetical protein